MLAASIIVNTESDDFNHKQLDFLEAFAHQSLPHDAFELIYADGRDRESTRVAVREARRTWPRLQARVLPCATPARARGHNASAAQALSDLLIFLADDFEPAPTWAERHVEFHRTNMDERAVGIGPGYFTDEIRREPFARWLEDSGSIFGVPMRGRLAVWPQNFFYAGNSSIKRAMFDRVGGFDERFPLDAWDDYEFGHRLIAAGGYTRRVEAVAWHRHAVSLTERLAVLTHSAQNAHVMRRLHPDSPAPWMRTVSRAEADRAPAPDLAALERELAATDELTAPLLLQIERALAAAFARGYRATENALPADTV